MLFDIEQSLRYWFGEVLQFAAVAFCLILGMNRTENAYAKPNHG